MPKKIKPPQLRQLKLLPKAKKDKREVGAACPKCGWLTKLSPSPCEHKMERGMTCLARHYAWKCDRCKIFYEDTYND